MQLPSFPSLCVGFGLMLSAGLALAAGDAGLPVPKPPAQPIVDKGPRCEPAAVNQCRSTCERKTFEVKNGKTKDQLVNACKQDCIRGC
jgi:hypothetical protein